LGKAYTYLRVSIMRFVVSAVLVAVASAQTPSTTTTDGFSSALQRCVMPMSQSMQGNQECTQQMQGVSAAITGTDQTALLNFCSSACLPMLNAGFGLMGTCMQEYAPTLRANLEADGVPNATEFARTMLAPYSMLPDIFNLMCTRNDQGDFCMPLFSRMGSDLAAAGGATADNVCNLYFNTGCCLTALDKLYSSLAPEAGTSFLTSMLGFCPIMVNFSPPPCVVYGQTAVALSVTAALTGLNCGVFAQQTDEFKAQFDAAIKSDLANAGINPSYVTVVSPADVNGVCTLTLVVRAGTDAATRELKTTLTSTMSTATLTKTNEVLATAPTTTTGSVTMSEATVAETTIQGQSVGGQAATGSSVVPGFLLIAGSMVAMHLA